MCSRFVNEFLVQLHALTSRCRRFEHFYEVIEISSITKNDFKHTCCRTNQTKITRFHTYEQSYVLTLKIPHMIWSL